MDEYAKVILGLRRNRARDPGGWLHELLIWTWQTEAMRTPVVKWLISLQKPATPPVLLQLIVCCHLVLLRKPGGAGVRPITLWSRSGVRSTAGS